MSNLSTVKGNESTTAPPKSNTSSFGGFGGFNSSFGFGAQQKPQKPPDPLYQRLYKIRDAYDTKADTYRFWSVVQNVSAGGTSVAAQPPKYIDPKEWAKAKQYPIISKDSTSPAQLSGFKELQDRFEQQKKIVDKMTAKLDVLKKRIAGLRIQYDERFISLIQDISANSYKISEKLMEVLKSKEIAALPDLPFSPEEHQLFDRLQKLEKEIYKPNQYVSALNALNLKSTMIRESGAYYPDIELTEQTDATELIIQSNHEAIESLVNIISKMNKQTNVLEKTMKEETSMFTNNRF
ncbi:hypothetical protein TRFO_37832 [Tritrichomonas foetus]|uniref:Nucleoporin Nup54 alpha-helical domain-containing protein n=1 Tax=Tritrichomonas foetus TaxID=1144522 RepID=A0A1J4JA80_9EUKA|nr:hypothetical protein TRFO_37832 [Tritrichomonas foetus]|eukprot:OHS96072.1 hypothetical protein TRFO_37832 [Tritrichomonas foetus]